MTVPPQVLAAVRSIPHPRQEPDMSTPHPSPAGLSPLLDQLDEARAAVAVGAWEVTDDEHRHGVHEYGIWVNDGEHGRYVVEVIPSPADAALIVAAVNAAPELIAELRKRDAAVRAVEALHVPSHSYCVVCDVERDVEVVGNNPRCEHRTSFCRACEIAWPCPTVRALTAALTPGGDTAGATA